MSASPTPETEALFGDRVFAGLQHLLPKHLLTRIVYSVARSRSPTIRNLLLRNFLRAYEVNLAEAAQPDPYAYASFNEFFTRALRPGARPIAESDAIVSPVDGTVSQCGYIEADLLLQAKGHNYSLQELLAGDAESADRFRHGSFACIYLAPYNYHRIHVPVDARVRRNIYVPGELFSVNAATARTVRALFARNERLICDFDTPVGRMAVILVGALFVGSVETVHCGEVNPLPRRQRGPQSIKRGVGREFSRGEELGRFNMGSTVILLFERGRIRWDAALAPLATVQMGRAIAYRTQP
jgi:phosphatidylserine decarboxylase